jgi:hypothetical protein
MKNKILKHSLFFFFLISTLVSNAQIIYTDLIPNITAPGVYQLDLNNDGIPDFNISTINFSGGLCNGYWYGVQAYGFGSNMIAGFATNVNEAIPLNYGDVIGASTSWGTQTALKSKYHNWSTFGSCVSGDRGVWKQQEKYLGLKLVVNGQVYYGWVRIKISVSASNASYIISDYGYDNTLNHSINAGAMSGARLAEKKEVNSTKAELTSFPNPISSSTKITFSIASSQDISLKIFDIRGKEIAVLADGVFEEGFHEFMWDAEKANAGNYILQLKTGEICETKKLIVIK